MFSEWQEIPINESEGKISAASIIPYPPGIPLINPGERITPEYLDYINLLLSCNCPVHGVDNGRIRTVAAK
jgi:arginine/lysine/ornithine decarboxylase